jgi:c-di-GMP-binding flagellar brake protein YcgR
MSDLKPDKRARSRIRADIPAVIKTKQEATQISAVTRDLSATGVFLYTEKQIEQGSKLEVILILPAELGLGEKQWACCQASVVRVEEGGEGKFGVAATIDRLDLLPEVPI